MGGGRRRALKATTISHGGVWASARAWAVDYAELIKARLTLLVLLTTLIGFYMGSSGVVDRVAMIHTLLATAMVASGAAALNQWMERDSDGRMQRTRNRPLPAGRIYPEEAFLFGAVISLAGMVYLALCVNGLASLISGITLGIYLFVYTPLKKVTWLNTVVGAVPGALPPLIGWVGARGELSPESWVLFAIMFFWQMPHFLSIAWIYREDYAAGGYRMLPVVEPDGRSTARQSLLHAMFLWPISLLPTLLGMAGWWYLAAAGLVSLFFLWAALRFDLSMTRRRARGLFAASILYLPLLFGLMVWDKA